MDHSTNENIELLQTLKSLCVGQREWISNTTKWIGYRFYFVEEYFFRLENEALKDTLVQVGCWEDDDFDDLFYNCDRSPKGDYKDNQDLK